MTKVYFIRHVEAEGNLFRRAQGQCDTLITANGHRQVAALRKRFENVHIDEVYSSDLLRARLTASSVYVPKKLTLHLDKGLREFGLGEWEGVPLADWAMSNPVSRAAYSAVDPNFSAKGAENSRIVQERVVNTFWKIVNDNSDKTILIVSHGMALRILLNTFAGVPLEEMKNTRFDDNAAVSYVEVENGKVNIIFRDDNKHVEDISTRASVAQWVQKQNGIDHTLYFRDMDTAQREGDFVELYKDYLEENKITKSEDAIKKDIQALSVEGYDKIRIAYYEGLPVGYVLLKISGQECKLYVRKSARNWRLGIQLIGEAIHFIRVAKEKGFNVILENDSLRNFMDHYGYEINGDKAWVQVDLPSWEAVHFPKK